VITVADKNPIKYDIERIKMIPDEQQKIAKQAIKKTYKDHEPSGGASPRGDLGSMSEHERKMFFPKPIKGGNIYSSPKHLPMGKVRVECDDSPMKPLMKAGSPVYPEYCLPDHSGVKAGSMVGGHGKNARGTAAMISQPAAVKQKGNSKHPIVNKRVKNV
jgi:hypothetical protein